MPQMSGGNKAMTTMANAIVAPVHPKAMPVILTTTEEFDSGWRAKQSRR